MLNINKDLDSKLKPVNIAKKKSGFTLIELIVVIAIIAILAAALTPSFTGYIKEARKVTVINQAKNVVTAYESINAKTTSKIPIDNPVATFISSYGGDLLTEDDIKNIDLNNITVEDCFHAIDSDNYTFTLDTNNILASPPTQITAASSTN